MFKGYRTIIFNVAMALIVIVKAIFPDAEVPDGATVDSALAATEQVILAVTLIGNLILRAFTTTPIFKKDTQV
jgi:hypothetical protein